MIHVFQFNDQQRTVGQVGIIEWVSRKWWVVQVTNADGSFTPLYEAKNRTDAEQWITDNHAEASK